MTTGLVTESPKLAQYPGSNYFNHTIEVDSNLLDAILLNLCQNNSKTANVFNNSELIVVDTSPNKSFTIIANALRAGVNVISPNLLKFTSEQILELISIAQEIGVDLGFLPVPNVILPGNTPPVIIDSVRELPITLQIENITRQIAFDLIYLLTPVKAEIRKVKVYWLPLYNRPIKTLKLIVDFNDNSVITYLLKNGNGNGLLKVELIADEFEKMLQVYDNDLNPDPLGECTIQNIDYFKAKRVMMYPSTLAFKSKQIVEMVVKKISG